MTKEQEEAIKYLKKRKDECEKDIKLCKKREYYELLDKVEEEQKQTEIVLNLIQQLQEENKQKDKMIDEMIEEYEFFHRANIINFCEDKLRKNTCIQDCKNCIKQYFQKKASEE